MLLVTKIYDDQDEDPDYTDADDTYSPGTDLPGRPTKTGRVGTLGLPEGQSPDLANNNLQGKPGSNAVKPFSVNRNLTEVNAHASWVTYNQSYEVLETNPTIHVEGLADVSKSDFEAPESSYVNAGLTDTEDTPGSRSSNVESLVTNTNCNYEGRTKPTYRSHDEVFDPTGYASSLERTNAEAEFNALPVRPQSTYAMTAPRYFIKVTGHAIRAKYKVPIPTVLEIAGVKAIRTGTGRFKQKYGSRFRSSVIFSDVGTNIYD